MRRRHGGRGGGRRRCLGDQGGDGAVAPELGLDGVARRRTAPVGGPYDSAGLNMLDAAFSMPSLPRGIGGGTSPLALCLGGDNVEHLLGEVAVGWISAPSRAGRSHAGLKRAPHSLGNVQDGVAGWLLQLTQQVGALARQVNVGIEESRQHKRPGGPISVSADSLRARFLPIWLMRAPSTTTVACRMGSLPVPSITVACRTRFVALCAS